MIIMKIIEWSSRIMAIGMIIKIRECISKIIAIIIDWIRKIMAIRMIIKIRNWISKIIDWISRILAIKMIIKIIDWSSRITAVLLAIGGAYGFIVFAIIIDPPEFGWHVVIGSLIFFSFFQIGLFFAPAARGKAIGYRVIIAILMLPSSLVLFVAVIGGWGKVLHNVLCRIIGIGIWSVNVIEWDIKIIGMFIMVNICMLAYTTQYYLLFKDKKTKRNIQNV